MSSGVEATTKTVYNAFAVHAAGEDLKAFAYEPLELKDHEVEIHIEACGVCHSDVHQRDNDWKIANYPLVPGHEIIGEIVAVGKDVKDLKIGQRVGVTPQTGSCGTCAECGKGAEQLCFKKDKSYNSATGDPKQPHTYGGFSDYIRCDAKWAFPIPDGLSTVDAAPLLCAGLTTYSPLLNHKIGKGHKVGIVGVGGLGHIALQISKAMGAETVAISSSNSKEAEAKSLGADSFLVSSDAKAMAQAANTFDFLLCTVSANGVNWQPYFHLLRPDGTLCIVGLPTEMVINPAPLVGKRLSLSGSYLASNKEIHQMLEFCAKHGIKSISEPVDMTEDGVNLAMKKCADNTARFRMVLVNRKFKSVAEKA